LTKSSDRIRASDEKESWERNGLAKEGARGKGPQIVARACGERDDWLPKTEQVDIRPRPPGVRNAPDKARVSINLSREKKNAAAKIAPPAPDAKKKKRRYTDYYRRTVTILGRKD